MRIITIGRAHSSTICIQNDYVSSEHAELLLMDNGDILLTDKGSRNGTFLHGVRIEPGVDVPVRRGDDIDFAGVPLNWGSVPVIELLDPTKVRGVYGVGKNAANKYCLSGDSVSRYHATIKEMKNGKWFIQDHSTNGTYVNGQRIPSNQDYPIKKGDSIVCGKSPLVNPIGGNSGGTDAPWVKILIGVLTAACVAVVLFIALGKNGGGLSFGKDRVNPDNATAMVVTAFEIKGFKVNGRNTEYYLYSDGDGYNYVIDSEHKKSTVPVTYYYTGTAFFISDDGLLVTNKHITQPWNYLSAEELSEFIGSLSFEYTKYSIFSFLEDIGVSLSLGDMSKEEWQMDFIRKFSENVSFIVGDTYLGLMYPNVKYSSYGDSEQAFVEVEAEGNVDVSIIRLNSYKTPERAEYFNMKKAVADFSKVKKDVPYYTDGYPGGLMLSDYRKQTSTHSSLHLAQNPMSDNLTFQGDASIGGQSGSAIYDSKHRLVAVLNAGDRLGKEQTYGVPVHYVMDLLDKVQKSQGK